MAQNIDSNGAQAVCSEVQDLLYLFVIGDLEGDDLSLVVSHLGACGECREALVQHSLLNKALIQAMPTVKPNIKLMHA